MFRTLKEDIQTGFARHLAAKDTLDVIGETAEIGDDVQAYQGVVIGGASLEKRRGKWTKAF
jgi:hypothetical protein